MAYQSKDSLVLENQLQVQEVNVQITDAAILSTSASTVTINLQEPIGKVTSALFFDDSAGTVASIPAASRTVSGNSVTLTLAAAFAANDTIKLNYVINEQA